MGILKSSLLVLLLAVTAHCGTQELSQDALDTSGKVSTVNENFRGLSYNKLDLYPRGIMPFTDSKYTLGEVGREWLAIYVDTAVVTSLTVQGGTFTLSAVWDGWVGAGETWTYIAATQFSIVGDKTGKYAVGDKIKLTQTSAKYFYVTAVAYSAVVTTVTVTGGTSYTLANAAITSPYSSKVQTPQGFPHWFAYTPTWTSAGTQPDIGNGTLVGRFTINGKTVVVQVRFVVGNSSTMGTSDYYWALPVTANTGQPVALAAPRGGIGDWAGADSGVSDYGGIVRMSDTAATKVELSYPNIGSGVSGRYTGAVGQTQPFTWGTNDNFAMQFMYEMN